MKKNPVETALQGVVSAVADEVRSLPKIHCYGAIEHYRKPVCGKKLPYERCVSRTEFAHVSEARRCKACAATRWARFM